ncbi:MAG TPA: hypothetical protein VH079_08465 [Terriglobales bacterium]|nr:hypothetical protein [Terriglobales bacterium]
MDSQQQNRWGYLVVWEFVVKPGMEAGFEEVYGPSGDWVRLFRKDENYLGTELNRGQGDLFRYVTLDFWVSEKAYREFRKKHRDEYQVIDQKCEQLTESERELAKFIRTV